MDISQLKEIFMEGMASFAETFDTSKEFKNPYDCITQPSQHAAWKNGWTASYELMQLSLNEK